MGNSKYYSKYSKKHIKKMSKFIKHLEQILEENGKSLGAKGLSRFKTETISPPSTDSEFTAYDDLNLDVENQTKILKTGTGQEPQESKRKHYCNVCNGEHLTYLCPTLSKSDTDQCINLIVSKQICPRCLSKAREDCEKQECNSTHFDRHGRVFSTLCPGPCDKGVNKAICCRRPSQQQEDQTLNVTTLTTGATSTDTPTILNSVPVGASASLVETMQYLVEGVGPVNVGVLYDPAVQASVISSCLRPFVKGYKGGNFRIDTISGSKVVNAGTGCITLKAKDGPLNIQGIVQEMVTPFTNSHRIKMPVIWQKLYKLPNYYQLNDYLYQIIIGGDNLEYHPTQIIAHRGLVLSQSKLTDRVLISGFNKDHRSNPGHKAPNVTSIMRIGIHELLSNDHSKEVYSDLNVNNMLSNREVSPHTVYLHKNSYVLLPKGGIPAHRIFVGKNKSVSVSVNKAPGYAVPFTTTKFKSVCSKAFPIFALSKPFINTCAISPMIWDPVKR